MKRLQKDEEKAKRQRESRKTKRKQKDDEKAER